MKKIERLTLLGSYLTVLVLLYLFSDIFKTIVPFKIQYLVITLLALRELLYNLIFDYFSRSTGDRTFNAIFNEFTVNSDNQVNQEIDFIYYEQKIHFVLNCFHDIASIEYIRILKFQDYLRKIKLQGITHYKHI